MTKLCAAPAHNIIAALTLAQTITESFTSEILRFIALVCVKVQCWMDGDGMGHAE